MEYQSTTHTDMPLDDNELYFCRIVAAMRNDPKEDARVQSKKILSNRSEYDTHLIGMCAEFVVAKYFQILPALQSLLGGDGNCSDITINGYTCQIKCRPTLGYDFALLSASPEEFRADCGVLVYMVDERLYRIQGVISRARFNQVAVVKDYGYGPRLVAEWQYFSPIGVLAQKPKGLAA